MDPHYRGKASLAVTTDHGRGFKLLDRMDKGNKGHSMKGFHRRASLT